MKYGFRDLVDKKKDELVEIAKIKGVDNPQSIKKKELIEEIAEPILTNLEFKLLFLDHESDATWSRMLTKMCKKLSIKGYGSMNTPEKAVALLDFLEGRGYNVSHDELPKERRRLSDDMKERLFTGHTSINEIHQDGEARKRLAKFIEKASKMAFKNRVSVPIIYDMKEDDFKIGETKFTKEHEISVGVIFCH